jgi:hypothetical protein
MATAKKSAKKSAASSKPAKPADVAPKPDPKRKARYAALAKSIKASRKDTLSNFDALYEAIAEVLDHELFLDGGYRSASQWIEEVVREPTRTVLRNARVAKYATPAEEERYGVAKLDCALDYIEAVAGGATKVRLPVRFDAIKIATTDADGATKKLSLDEASVRDIEAARKRLTASDEPEKTERRSPAERAIVKALREFASLSSVTVSVSDAKVKLGELPLYALDDLRRALANVKLDER